MRGRKSFKVYCKGVIYIRKLYFQHSNGKEEYICDIQDDDLYVSIALEDLYRRNPKYQSYYQRKWKDNDGSIWIDVGSHTEFYIVKNSLS